MVLGTIVHLNAETCYALSPFFPYFCGMNYLSVENLSKAFGERKLFSNISFGIAQGQKIALVGINGAGKSTLMKIIMGQEIADTGQVALNQLVKIA